MQPGGGGRFSSRFQRRAPGGGGMMSRVGGRPQRGGLAAMQQQAQQQQAGFAGRLPPGIDPQAVAANPEGYAQWAADPRSAGARGVPTKPMPGPSGPYNPGPVVNLPPPSPGGTVYDQNWPPRGPMAPGGDPFAPGEGIPGGGNIPPWKRLPGGRPQVPPSPGGEITGGPRVPPNQRGYLQKQRMMNRPPSGPVGGGGGNRVGMADQQGALARAMQKGTGRAPMSRRMAFGRGAQQ
jgi:integrin beta 3